MTAKSFHSHIVLLECWKIMCLQQCFGDRLISKLTLVSTVKQLSWSLGAHYDSCWALGVSCRWFISTRKRKCRSFLFSLPITTWRPLSRPPSLISRWVVVSWVGSKELPCEGVIHSCCLWRGIIARETVNLLCYYAWRYLRIDLQMKHRAVMLCECHGGS